MKKWALAILAALAACLVMMGGTRDVKAASLPTGGLHIDSGSITINDGNTSGKITVAQGSTTYDEIESTAEIKIDQTNSKTVTTNSITVNAGNGVKITLAGVNIQAECAFDISEAAGTVTLTLADDTDNQLLSTGLGHAGIHKENTANLTIAGGQKGNGKLYAQSNASAAGIGGGFNSSGSTQEDCTNITIKGGIITAVGAGHSAGIGGGMVKNNGQGNCSNITIEGGSVTARGDGNEGNAPGIGGGNGGDAYSSNAIGDYNYYYGCSGGSCTGINISGGIVDASIGGGNGRNMDGDSSGAIHPLAESYGGNGGDCSNIVISGGTVNCSKISGGIGGSAHSGTSRNGTLCPGGNGGNGGGCSNITITGGTVTCSNISGGAAGAGGSKGSGSAAGQNGSDGNCSSVYISGGSVNTSIGTTPAVSSSDSRAVYLTTVTLDGITKSLPVTALKCVLNKSDYTYRLNDVYTDENSKLYLWLPADTVTSSATLTDGTTATSYLSTSEIKTASGTVTTTGTLYGDSPVTITYKASTGGSVNPTSESPARVTGTATGSKATSASGYHFVNWTDLTGKAVSTEESYTPAKVGGLNVATTYKANFAVNPTYYTITASASPSEGGTVTGDGTYVEGSSVTLKAAIKEGYTFLGWYEDGKSIGTGATIDIAVSGDRTITAHFRASSSARVFGTTRYDTMAETVKKAFPDGCETAVLASGENWPDALSASSLAGVKGCPVILTEPGQLTQQTADLLASLKVKNVIIVGGTSAISDDVKAAVEAKSITTERIWGNDRTQTADLVARRVIDSSDADTIIICSGQNFPDALSISSYAYAKKMPILLAGSDGKLTADSLTIAENFGKAIIVGGEKAVSLDVEKQLTVMKTARYEGKDRYGTSIDVINKLFDGYAPVLAVATGTNYPDALVGAALAGKSGGTILLVDGSGTSLTDDQKTIIGNAGDVWILGGDGAVSDTMKTAINNVLK